MVGQGGIYVGLGSNLGDRGAHIRAAIAELESAKDIRVLAQSSLHETEPVGGPAGQSRYLNAVIELATKLSPEALLRRLQETERRHGRERGVRHGPRTLDLDLLLYRARRIDTPELTVPHPRMWEREFVMAPLREICPPEQLDSARRAGSCGATRAE